MAISDEQIFEQNPWWTTPGWRAGDPHLASLDTQPVRLASDFVADLDLRQPGIHILRGPRQVGKSTDLKLLVERALREETPPRSIVYLALDLLEGRHLSELAASVRRALDLAGHDDGPGLLLLDEVTAVSGWQTAIKSLWDHGQIRENVVVCTGSSAIDLQRGAAERLPGRRGDGIDHLALPQSFAEFAGALDDDIPPSPALTVSDLREDAGAALLHDMRPYGPALKAALELYLRFGGLPAAVAEAANGEREPSRALRRVLWDSLLRELQRKGAGVPAAQALLERVVRSLGAKVSWSSMAREMDVPLGRGSGSPSHVTLRDYIELLAAGYFLFVTYFWRGGSQSNEISKDKKVFFADPLLHTIALEGAPGLRADIPALVENAVGIALLRRYEPSERLIETFVLPERMHIWQTSRGGEIDFVCGPRRKLDLVEVKYREHPSLSAAAAAARVQPGRPVVMATKDTLRVSEHYTLLPAHTLLWALG
ncbi:MAG: ATP-binding protein [Solirubrobacteraceae bacterium]